MRKSTVIACGVLLLALPVLGQVMEITRGTAYIGKLETTDLNLSGTFTQNAFTRASAGTLAIADTTATGVSICNSAACDSILIGNNADADTITIGDVTDTAVSITDDNWSVSAGGVATFAHLRAVAGNTLTAADVNLTKANIQAAGVWLVDTTANIVDVDFANDAVLDAADIGSVKKFIVSVGGTNELTVTAGASGVTTLMNIQQGAGASCEDVNDSIEVTVLGTAAARVETFCAD